MNHRPLIENGAGSEKNSILKSDRAAYKATRQAGESPARAIPISAL